MGYEKRIAEDWLHTYSNDDEVGSDRDPLFIMETAIEANPSTSWLIPLEIINLDIDGLTTEVLAFGPFASWAYHYARDWIETIEHEARDNRFLRRVLRELPQNSIDEETWRRIEFASLEP
nr:hypothetical protein [Mesorhizobium sp.]